MECLTITVEKTAKALNISRGAAYEGVRRGDIPSFRVGRRILIPMAWIERVRRGLIPAASDSAQSDAEKAAEDTAA